MNRTLNFFPMESQFSQHCCEQPAAWSVVTGIKGIQRAKEDPVGENGTSLLNIRKAKMKRPLSPEDTTLLGKLL